MRQPEGVSELVSQPPNPAIDTLIRLLPLADSAAMLKSLALTDLQFNRVIFRARGRLRELLERRGYGKSDFLAIGLALIG